MQSQIIIGSNGNGHMTIEQLQKKLEKLRKPGRPSKQVLDLRAEIAMRQQDEVPEKTPGRRAPKRQEGIEKVEARRLHVPPIVQEAIEVQIVGVSDLIQHAWDEKTIREMEEKQAKTVGRSKEGRPLKEARNPRAEYEASRYLNHKRQDCAPAVQFKKCMVSAASRITGVTMKDINTAVFVKSTDPLDTNLVPLKFNGKAPMMRRDMVKIGKFPNKVATPRYRPGYQNWSCTLRIEYDTSVISAEQVVNLLNRGGFGVGIAEWRPEKGGEFGRFTVKNVRTAS